jgi:formylglycine-generating enzyme required for sulfatase activity
LGAWLAPLVARAAGGNVPSASLSFAGTLRQNGAPMATPQTLAFVFKKNGIVICQSPDLSVTPDETGQFMVAIPIASCPSSLFDGSEVKIDIAVGGDLAVSGQPITSVPSAKYAEQVGFPDCPLGYERDLSTTNFIVCRFGSDEVVRVGAKSTAFWIDRYEASVWEQPEGTGKIYGPPGPDAYPISQNGQLGAQSKAYAVSKAGVLPSASITWFQADVVCRASGKRLPTSAEWGFAASGTIDPGESPGTNGVCRTSGLARSTGQGSSCTSFWGAQDMIGNVAEWISEWFASPPSLGDNTPLFLRNWGPGHADDSTANIASIAGLISNQWTNGGVPAGGLRGGYSGEGAGAGVFNFNLTLAPNNLYNMAGFRCVIPR